MVMIIALLIYIAYRATTHRPIQALAILSSRVEMALYLLMIWAVITSIISGYSYVKDHWELIIEGAK